MPEAGNSIPKVGASMGILIKQGEYKKNYYTAFGRTKKDICSFKK